MYKRDLMQMFRPERFLKGSPEAAARHPYAYLPFGGRLSITMNVQALKYASFL